MTEEITAIELGQAEKLMFFREILAPYLRAQPFVRWIARTLDRIPEDPVEAAERELVFEVHRMPSESRRR